MANEKNLIPFSERTESEQREIRSAGGKQSAENRRRRKSLKTTMKMILDLEPTMPNYGNLSALGVRDEDDFTNQTVMLAALFEQAANGNVKAVREIRSILGEQLETPLEARERRARTKVLEAEAEQRRSAEAKQSAQVVIVDDI